MNKKIEKLKEEINIVRDSFVDTPEEEKNYSEISKNILSGFPNADYKKDLIKELVDNGFGLDEEENAVVLSEHKIAILEQINNCKDRQLMNGLMIYATLNYHPSGWIRFNKEEINKYAKIEDLKIEDFYNLKKYGFKMRVCGSKAAIPTFLDPEKYQLLEG